MTKALIILAFSLPAIHCHATALNFYVAMNGSDTNSGSRSHPFHSFEQARNEIRRLKSSGSLPADGVSVIVRGGTYFLNKSFVLNEQDSETNPILWQAAPNEVVRLCGGLLVPSKAFHAVTNETILSRLDAQARRQVVQINLREPGITNLEGYPDEFRGAPDVPELFFNDQRQQVARWPNQGWATIAKIVQRGNSTNSTPSIFEYSGDRPARWNVQNGVWLLGYWCYDWYEESIKVKAIDQTNHQITLAALPHYGIWQGNSAPRRWRAENILEELDEPGEYYLDAQSGELYFWPPSNLNRARIVLSTLNAPLIQLTDATNLILRGFTIENGLGDGIDVTDGQSNSIVACEIHNLRQVGIRVSGGIGHRVLNCDVHDTGTGGIILSGGDRKTLTPAGLQAINNRIWNFAQLQLTYAPGIVLSGVGNEAAHNEIYGASHMAVGINGNDHIFEFNYVHNVCTNADDAGALYKGRNPSCRGNIIRYNFWRDIGDPSTSFTSAIYFDDGDGGDMVFGNIFLRCGHVVRNNFGAIFSHGGHGIFAENNLFIDCPRALGSSPWNDQHWKEMLEGNDWQNKLLKEVNITTAPYTNHYPALIGFMDGQPQADRISYPNNNVFVRCRLPNTGNWTNAPGKSLNLTNDPGFVDFAGGNLKLRPDSIVFKRLPDFQPIPFDKIGIEK